MKYVYLIIIALSAVLLFFTIRGESGNPTPREIEFEQNVPGRAFESSQERARYAQVLSLYHEQSVAIDTFASMGTPDIGKINGHYYSFFPPVLSVMALPFYHAGLLLGMSQLFTFLVPGIFWIGTMLVVARFAGKLGLPWPIALFCTAAFGFATNAWSYSVTFYAHIVSAFFVVSGLYLVSTLKKGNSFLKLIVIWLLYGIAVWTDYPNIFTYMPIAVLALVYSFTITEKNSYYILRVKLLPLLAPLVFLAVIAGYGWYNHTHFGSPLTLSNTIPRVRDLHVAELAIPETNRRETNALDAFKTRNMLEGFNSFLFRLDRGMLIYSPVVLLFVFGILRMKHIPDAVKTGLVSVPLINIVMYSMFGDPYGGWAFGSRYMIVMLPELVLLAGLGLYFTKGWIVKLIYSAVFIYSAAISLLGTLTTNVIPPKIEAVGLGLDWTYRINIKMLTENNLSSFAYNTYFSDSLSGISYYHFISIRNS